MGSEVLAIWEERQTEPGVVEWYRAGGTSKRQMPRDAARFSGLGHKCLP